MPRFPFVLLLTAACAQPTEPVSDQTAELALAPNEGPAQDLGRVALEEQPSAAGDHARVTLDEGIAGIVEAGLPGADHERLVRLTTAAGALPAGSIVLDARHVDGVVVSLDRDHRLRVQDGSGRVLDEDVNAPLSVFGSRIAYARGEMPLQEIAVVDVHVGAPMSVTEGYAPAWNPALGPDGAFLFVSGRAGSAQLFRSTIGGTPAVIDTEVFPSSLTAPRFDGHLLAFEDEAGVAHALVVDPQEGAP